MTTSIARKDLNARAADALKALMEQISAIKLLEIRCASPAVDHAIDVMAHIDVWGHCQTIVCKVAADGQATDVRTTLLKLRNQAAHFAGGATPVFIAPSLLAETRALCVESGVGFLDLKGNAHLFLGEAFIAKRSLPHCDTDLSATLFAPAWDRAAFHELQN